MYNVMVLFSYLRTKCIHHFSRQTYLAILFFKLRAQGSVREVGACGGTASMVPRAARPEGWLLTQLCGCHAQLARRCPSGGVVVGDAISTMVVAGNRVIEA